uniref:Uncharacterized protein n=1 Tax=Sphaerodactylus townsendi TaxID=933632 RepID=A0ACB8F5J3_9SAUR
MEQLKQQSPLSPPLDTSLDSKGTFYGFESDRSPLHPAINLSTSREKTFLSFESHNYCSSDEEENPDVRKAASGHLDPPIEEQKAVKGLQPDPEALPCADSPVPGLSSWPSSDPVLSQSTPPAP